MASIDFVYKTTTIPSTWLNDVDSFVYSAFNVQNTAYGAVGNGSTDDTVAIQAAVTAACVSGGVVVLPCSSGQIYKMTGVVNVQSLYPVHIISYMAGGYSQNSPFGSFISIAGANAGFKYSSPTGVRSDSGGGVVRGLAFRDLTGGSSVPGTNSITAALWLYDFNLSAVENCSFHFLNGSAIKTDFCVMTNITGTVIRYCGDGSKPALWLSSTDATYCTQSTNVVNTRLEVNHDAPYLQIDDNSHSNKLIGLGFECDTLIAGSVQKHLSIASDRNNIVACHFNRSGAAVQVELTSTAQFNTIGQCEFHGTANSTAAVTIAGTDNLMTGCTHSSGKTGDEITGTGVRTTITAPIMTQSGGITLAANSQINGGSITNSTTTNAYVITLVDDSKAVGVVIDHDGSGTIGGIKLSGTGPIALGCTVKDFIGIGIRNESANGVVLGNQVYANTGLDLSNTQANAIVGPNWIQDRGASSSNAQIAPFRYSTIPIGGTAYNAIGTSTTPVAGTIYWAEIYIDAAKSLTTAAILNAGTVGTNKHILALYAGDGTLIVSTALAGTLSAGPNVFQEIALTATTVVSPGRYWAALQMDGNTDRFRSVAASTFINLRTTSGAGAFGTLTALTPVATFTADVGPVMYFS